MGTIVISNVLHKCFVSIVNCQLSCHELYSLLVIKQPAQTLPNGQYQLVFNIDYTYIFIDEPLSRPDTF